MFRKVVVLTLALLLCAGLATGAAAQPAQSATAMSAVTGERLQLPSVRRAAELSIVTASCGFSINKSTGVGELGADMMCDSTVRGCKITAIVQRRNTGNGPWLYYKTEKNVDYNADWLDILRYVELELGYQYQVEFTFVSYDYNLVPLDMAMLTSYAYWYY